jgi:aspartyl-tRNA(Asn)/glutamyl-tRNA(Gln) amidotransferase subunit A
MSLSATDLSALVGRREISALEVVNAALSAISEQDGEIHAFVTVGTEEALAAARDIDARLAGGESVGPLVGVPVAIKDLLSTKGMRTTFGSRHYADHIPHEDDVAVERLRAAGAIVIGKTNTSEFGYGAVPHNALFATTRNPWDIALSPGGSSAGSAAAIAAGMVPLALGSDGGGSIRVPAAFTGIVGFKPSWGRIPVYPGCRDPDMPGASGWESLEHVGPLARSVGDIRVAYDVMRGPDPRDRHSIPSEAPTTKPVRRVAFSPDLGFAAVDADVLSIARNAAEVLADALGATLELASPPIGDVQPTFEALVALDTDRRGLLVLRDATQIGFGPELTALLARQWTADDFSEAIFARQRIVNALARFLGVFDILVTPATATAATRIGDEPTTIGGRHVGSGALTPFSAMANLAGLPAISIPAGLTADGRPVGLQLVGGHLADEQVLSAAAAFEAARPFPRLLDKSAPARHSLTT